MKRHLSELIKQRDCFGHPIAFKYKNSAQFKSLLGGFTTFFVFFLLLFYFIYQSIGIFNRQTITVVNSLVKKDLSVDETIITLTKKNFDIAVYLMYGVYNETIQNDIDLYFSTYIQEVDYHYYQDKQTQKEKGVYYGWDLNNLDLELCQKGRFAGTVTGDEILGIYNHHHCPKDDFEIHLQGSYSSQKAKMLQVMIDYCDQSYLNTRYPGMNKKCKSKQESLKILPLMQVYIPIMTQYFDQKEFHHNPIKNQINNDIYLLLTANVSSNYIYKVSENQVNLYDSFLSNLIQNKQETYYDVRLSSYYLTQIDPSNYAALATVSFLLDENISTIDRNVQTILDAFSQTGGMMGIVFFIASQLIGWIQESLFHSSIMRKIFFTQQKHLENEKQSRVKIIPTNNENQDALQYGDLTGKTKAPNSFMLSDRDRNAFDEENGDFDMRISPVTEVPKHNFNTPDLPSADSIFNYIKSMNEFVYQFKDFMRLKFKNLLCRSQNHRLKDLLYQQAIKNLEKQFDVVKVFKSMKKIDLLTQITLPKYQQYFLPYLKSNVLDFKPKSDDEAMEETTIDALDDDFHNQYDHQVIDDEKLKLYLRQLVLQSSHSKIDKRILKNLTYYKKQKKPKNKKQSDKELITRLQNNKLALVLMKKYSSGLDNMLAQQQSSGKLSKIDEL